MSQTVDEAIETGARVLAGAQYTVALVGAGISVESGIPPFRGPGGLWTKHGEPPMDGYQRFMADPEKYWRERREQMSAASEFTRALAEAAPNAAHLAMASMEREGLLQHVITQNIDNLHQVAGSVAVTEIHGNRTKMRCTACNRRWAAADFDAGASGVPRCPDCRGIVKGDTVMFGEPIPLDALESCHEQARLCDCMLLVGTSAVVYPAAEFPVIAYRQGASLIEVNPMETPLSDIAVACVRAPAGEAMPRLLERALALRRQEA